MSNFKCTYINICLERKGMGYRCRCILSCIADLNKCTKFYKNVVYLHHKCILLVLYKEQNKYVLGKIRNYMLTFYNQLPLLKVSCTKIFI